MNELTKAQLVLLARKAGWSGDEARHDKGYFVTYLTERGVDPETVTGIVSRTELAGAVPVRREPERSPADQLAQAIAQVMGSIKPGLDVDAVQAIVDARIGLAAPVRIVVNAGTERKVEGRTHPLFEKVLRLVRAGVNVLLVGPAGCGKSYLAKQVAAALGYKFGTLHCSAGVSESQVTGWLLPIGEGGTFKFMPAQFATLYVEGNSLFLIDEIDAADPNMLTVLNGALANGALHIPQCPERPEWQRGENAAIIAAANTWGQGADAAYVGRNQLDAATLDRFYIVSMEYDAALEASIAGLPYTPAAPWSAAPDASAQELAELAQWALDLRTKAGAGKLRRIISTRTIQKTIAARSAGIPAVEVKRDILAGWTRDELAKVGE